VSIELRFGLFRRSGRRVLDAVSESVSILNRGNSEKAARRRVSLALHKSDAAKLLEIETKRRLWEERIEPENYDLLRLPRPDGVFVGLERRKVVGRNSA
jgi:hypothetical protein